MEGSLNVRPETLVPVGIQPHRWVFLRPPSPPAAHGSSLQGGLSPQNQMWAADLVQNNPHRHMLCPACLISICIMKR